MSRELPLPTPMCHRSAGLLLHPTSLPSRYGVGDLGAGARDFVDWLVLARLNTWQILPLVPPGAFWSPYASYASLACNPWLLDPVALAEDGLLDPPDLDVPDLPLDWADFELVEALKGPLIHKAARRLATSPSHPLHDELEAFRAAESWVDDTALFVALKDSHGGAPWWQWPAPERDRDPAAMAVARRHLAPAIAQHAAAFFLADRQWAAVRVYANERDVRILGDVPIYVSRDSVDVWAHREQFRLDEAGRPLAVAGVPPDYFSETGQLWGNPLYDWDRMAQDHHAWWVARMRRTLRQVDFVRIDHFRGFAAYWEVPPDAPDARPGRWVPGPGRALFDDLKAALGPNLPIIAEDLGEIDDAVVALREEVGLPGMLVLQFAFGGEADHPFLPHNHPKRGVVYTGTHDNDTTRGFWRTAPDHVKDHIRRYLAVDGHNATWDLIRGAFRSPACLAVIPVQDVLDLDSGARMNTPGVGTGNWRWRVRKDAFNAGVAARVRGLAELYGRAASPPE